MQQLPVAMSLASARDNEMEFCFLLIQEKRLLPTQKQPLDVLFLSSAFLAQSALEYPTKTAFVSLLYHTPNSAVVFILYDSFQSNHIRLFGISLISSTHSHTITNVRSTSSKVKKTTYHAFIKR